MLDQIWCNIAVSSCIERNIDHFFLAPGSRCTPLTLAVANHNDAKITQHFDERALAYAALGYARATGRPGVFICTSGTAVANAYPAVIEAATDGVPMLLFTADRPPELRGTGANQTIDQQQIFGTYAKWFFDMPCAEEHIELAFVRNQVMRAVEESKTGPAQLNWMFREPFGVSQPDRALVRQSFVSEVDPPEPDTPQQVDLDIPGEALVIAGGCRPDEVRAAQQFASELDAPLLTDITSNFRGITPDNVSNPKLPSPNTVVHVGGRIVSKAWLKYTQSSLPDSRILHLSSNDSPINPSQHGAYEHILADLSNCRFNIRRHGAGTTQFRKTWEASESARRIAIQRVVEESGDQLHEPGIAWQLGQLIPVEHGLFIGNSTPIRDMDWFSNWPQDKDVVVGANRGASGIDGLLATAVGFAMGLDRKTTLLIGDLSALHDLNSMSLLAQSAVPLIVLIINNLGGGIFDLLPIAKQTEHYERFFATPHSRGFHHAAQMFDLNYAKSTTFSEFATQYAEATRSSVSTVIELRTDREYNMRIRKLIQAEISR